MNPADIIRELEAIRDEIRFPTGGDAPTITRAIRVRRRVEALDLAIRILQEIPKP